MNCFVIFFFGLICATVNSIRKRFLLEHCRRGFAVFSIITHRNKVFNVRIHNSHNLVLVKKKGDSVKEGSFFPRIVEHIPCSVIINKGRNFGMFSNIIICHIDVGICVNNERGKRCDCVDELGRGVNHVCFFHAPNMAQIWAKIKGVCATLISGTRGVDLLGKFPHIIKVS